MKKPFLFRRCISFLLAFFTLFSLCLVTALGATSAESRAYSTANPKGLLLYVGYNTQGATTKYPSYSSADITKLSAATTEFILCSGNVMYNSYKFSNSSTQQIITESKINNMSSSLINNPVDIDAIKSDYIYLLTGVRPTTTSTVSIDVGTHIDELFGNLDPMRYQSGLNSISSATVQAAISTNLTLDSLAADVVSQVNTIVSAVPNATIWLPFPHIAFQSLAAEYLTPFTQYVNYLKSALGTKWTSNIRGFYWGTEAVVQYYTPFNYSSTAANGFGNPLVQLMNSMDSLISSYSKSLLWIPYLGEGTETIKRNGYVTNRTTVFDYVIVQPGYYFSGTTSTYNNFALIKTSTLNNKLYDKSNAIIGGSKVTGAATIGYEMEIDSNVTQSTYNDRYWEYTDKFSTLKAYPHVFYVGDRNSICGTSAAATSCYNYVKTWLTS